LRADVNLFNQHITKIGLSFILACQMSDKTTATLVVRFVEKLSGRCFDDVLEP
jgi:hypothetical protein